MSTPSLDHLVEVAEARQLADCLGQYFTFARVLVSDRNVSTYVQLTPDAQESNGRAIEISVPAAGKLVDAIQERIGLCEIREAG